MMETFLQGSESKMDCCFPDVDVTTGKTNIMASLVVNFVLTRVHNWVAACQQKIVTVHAVYYWTANWKLFVWKQIAYGVIACTFYRKYCGWKKSCTTLDGGNPINNGMFTPINW